MNVLIVTFGNDMCQKYNFDFLCKYFATHGDTCKKFDILDYEREMLYNRSNARQHDFHDMMRSFIVNKNKSSPVKGLKDCINGSEIDVVISLHNTAVSYIESAVKDLERRLLVYSFIIDSEVSLNISEIISRYVVFSEFDARHIKNLGISTKQIFICNILCPYTKMDRNSARNKLYMCLEGQVVVLLTNGDNEAFVVDFIESFASFNALNVNLIVVCKKSKFLSDKINIKYGKYRNIGALFCSDKENLHIAAADYVIADTDMEDCICAMLNNKPLIVLESSFTDKALLRFFNSRRYLVSEKSAKRISEQLQHAITNANVRNNYITWQKELISNTSVDDLYNDIINNLYS